MMTVLTSTFLRHLVAGMFVRPDEVRTLRL